MITKAILVALLIALKGAESQLVEINPEENDVDFKAILEKKFAIKNEIPVLDDPVSSICITDLMDRNPINLGKVIVSPRDFIPGPLSVAKSPQKHFIIVGAGIAGLISAYILLEVGHKVTILESSNRVGGRIYTHYGNEYYADLGAMRFPPNHFVVQRAFHHFGIPLAPFTNYNEGDQGNYFFINNKYYPSEDILGDNRKEASLIELYSLFNITKEEIPRDADGKLESPETIGYRIIDETLMTEEMCANDLSLLAFLRQKFKEQNIPEKIIDLWAILTVNQPFLAKTADEYLTDSQLVALSQTVSHLTYVEVVNGSSVFPETILKVIQRSPNFSLKTDAQVKTVHHGGNEDKDGQIVVEYRNNVNNQNKKVKGDYIILTPTAKAIGLIKFVPDLPYEKRHALSNIQYMNAAKIFLKFRRPFWAERKGNKAIPILFGKPKTLKSGGTGITDSPLSQIYYPSNKNHGNSIIASYTWDYQADFFLSLSPEKTINMTLEELEKIHGPVVWETFMEGLVYNWAKNPHSHGAFVAQDPVQKYNYQELLEAGTNRMIFSAEYANKDHNGFVEAAMQSAVRNLVNKWPKLYEEKFLKEEMDLFKMRSAARKAPKA